MNVPHPEQYRWHPVPDRSALEEAALDIILDSAATSISERGRFNIVLAGGETPRGIYERVREAPTDWSAWHIYFGDERSVPPTEPELNSYMAGEAWLSHVPIPEGQIHVIPGDIRADKAAGEYAQILAGVDLFDLTLLGLGEDGHTASLFPGNPLGVGPDAPDVLPVFNSPKRPPQRITLSAARLSRSRRVVFLVSGQSKRKAVAAWRAGKPIPARAIMPEAGVDVLVESALLE